MARFTIGVAQLGTNTHSQCFVEVAKALAEALRRNGHEVVDFGPNQGRLIFMGLNSGVPVESDNAIPKDAIFFNTEQVGSAVGVEKLMTNLEVWRSRGTTIWDYAKSNIVALEAAGMQNVVHCPIGYIDTMSTFASPLSSAADTLAQDIDVLFYGSVNPRRLEILDALDKTGLNVVRLFGSYGTERDDMIKRTKIVLNSHFYARPIFEIFRVSHLLANAKCVVTEDGGCDDELETFAKQACVYVPREKIVDACVSYAKSPNARAVQAMGGYLRFRKTDFVANVKKALEQSGVPS
jgi:hypothetical protein